MKNFPKAGLLIVTLVIPALIFVFLKLFATNHYDLAYYNPEMDPTGNVMVQNGDTVFHKVSNSCPAFDSTAFTNALTVIHYLPQNCDDSCKLAVSQLQRIAGLRSDISDLNILSVQESVQNGREVLPLEVGKTGWKMADGSIEEIESGFVRELGVNVSGTKVGPAMNNLILVDRNGYVRGYYKGGDSEETDRLMAEIKILDYEKKHNAD